MELGGRELKIETGKLAKQASGAVTVQYGDTVILATVGMSKDAREGIDFLPLMVEYDEKMYASGKIKGSRFVKREGRPSDEAQLTARLIDRPLRPLFDERLQNEIQVVITTLSYDGENDPDIPAMIGAATAILISDIPFEAPLSGVRVGMVDGEFVLNPTVEARNRSSLDLIVAGTAGHIVMVEAGANEVPEKDILSAMEFGHKSIKKICKLQEEIVVAVGSKKFEIESEKSVEDTSDIKQKVLKFLGNRLDDLLSINTKLERMKATDELQNEVREALMKDFDDKFSKDSISAVEEKEKEKSRLNEEVKEVFHEALSEKVRADILQKEKRIGGRKPDEIRPLSINVGLFPRTHGTGLFTRGETQVLTVATLGAPGDEQIIDGMEEEYKKRFLHHYNMPAFATGEVAPSRWPSRRELGHGALAERAITPVLPDQEKFPYTIRLVSEVLEANGSTSMASTCASSLSLMDAGVPIKSAVAGIAMGLITDGNSNYKILTDIQGEEDHLGDMDFKVTGTKKGITCMQMDIKVKGITQKIFEEAIKRAGQARMEILDAMDKVISEPRKEMSPYAPRIESFHIKPDKIREVIGPGGKTINEIIDETDVKIDIDDDGLVLVSSTSREGIKEAVQRIKDIVREPEVGELFKGKVTRIENFGAFVEIFPKCEGLVHISELAPYRVEKVEDILKMGDAVDVIVTEIDSQGRVNLSKKLADIKLGKKPPMRPKPDENRSKDRRDRGSRGGFRKKFFGRK